MKFIYMIINYNDFDSTINLINNIKNYKLIDTILVVDNHSTDDSFFKLKKHEKDNLKIISTPINNGYSYAINYGVKYLLEKDSDFYIAISNSDIIIEKEDDLKILINGFNNDIGVVSPTIKEKTGLNRGWKMPSNIQDIKENISSKYIKNRLYDEKHYNNETAIVDVVSGSFFITKGSILKKINYMDENVFLYYEENILSKKLSKINLKEIIYNNIYIIHNHSITIDKNINKLKKYNLLKKSQRYFEIHYNKINLFNLLLLDITRWITYIGLFFKNIFKK